MKFHWTAIEIAYLQSATAVWRIVLLICFVPIGLGILHNVYHENKNHSGLSRTQITIIGFGNALESIGYIGYGLSRNGVDYAVSYFISTSGVMAKPTVQSALMNLVPADSIGESLGAKGVLDGVTGIAFSSIGMSFYSYTVAWKPELIFYVSAFGYFVVVLHCLWLKSNLN